MAEIYDFTVKTAQGSEVRMSEYAGKVLLIANTATQCGLTLQYRGLQALHERYAEQGLAVLDFPCNQFRGQAPESSGEIARICETRFGTQFAVFDKIEVNGAGAHPLFVYLKAQQPRDGGGGRLKNALFGLLSRHVREQRGDIRWNFTKFLVSRTGRVVGRFAPAADPLECEEAICRLLEAAADTSIGKES